MAACNCLHLRAVLLDLPERRVLSGVCGAVHSHDLGVEVGKEFMSRLDGGLEPTTHHRRSSCKRVRALGRVVNSGCVL